MKKNTQKGGGWEQRDETVTYKLGDLEADPDSPFSLPIRMPGWFPDGVELPWRNVQRLFPEELIGIRPDLTPIPFGVQFCEPSSNPKKKKKGAAGASAQPDNPQKWILGDRIYEPTKAQTTSGWPPLMCLMCDLAKRIRKYNASLYRLRRLHYWFKFNKYVANDNSTFPPANPRGGDVDFKDLPDPNTDAFRKLARSAETDWIKVTNELNAFIEGAQLGYPTHIIVPEIRLVALDMVEVNGYVVSMRVATRVGLSEVGGSSSHVSISSAFSSY